MTLTGFSILVALLLLVIWLYMALAAIPGKTARERDHPQADAINILAWVGLLLGLVPWLIALVWAYMKPVSLVENKRENDVG